ncbi:MAG: hypothetical protein IJV88_04070 [Ruminococcus sp.]|nr:hypothetical protein [Ruminococcus sp.]
MDYLKWSQEYYEEAEKVLRNISRLKDSLSSVPADKYRTTENMISMLRTIYYECINTGAHLALKAKESAKNAA